MTSKKTVCCPRVVLQRRVGEKKLDLAERKRKLHKENGFRTKVRDEFD